jgi:Ca2+-binding EF-hand superfamily protein
MGYNNEMLTSRLFSSLSRLCTHFRADNSAGINFIDFVRALNTGLFSKDKKEQDLFIFRIYDADDDDEISTLDLIEW